jgi:short subunit dehydrogenase-like uncharacterized protein
VPFNAIFLCANDTALPTPLYIFFFSSPCSFKWAISGRSPHKLQALHRSLGPIAAASIGVVIVDSNNQSSLDDLMAKTRVVISTTGPYTDLGDPLVRACASNGVHYADLSGEPFWQRDMIEKYDTLARNTGAKIVLASGYDSVPFGMSFTC